MYSTINGAKSRAKHLKQLFDDSGFCFPLHKCQAAIAKAGGFRDWRDLEGTLNKARRPVDPDAFQRRLLNALPQPCRPPVLAWLDNEPAETVRDKKAPPRWYRDVFPYLMATAALHRSRTALLRPGSGSGSVCARTLSWVSSSTPTEVSGRFPGLSRTRSRWSSAVSPLSCSEATRTIHGSRSNSKP